MEPDAKSPLYKRIASEIAARVRQGLYKSGFIPGESEIGREFDASRITVRGAMKVLEEAGLVEAIPGKGRRIAGSGAPLRSKRSKAAKKLKISCAVQDSNLQAYQTVVNRMNNLAMDDEIRFSVHFVGDKFDQSSFERAMSPEESNGLICIGVNDAALLSKVEACGVPSVHVNSSSPLVKNVVSTDDFAGGYIAGKRLADNGHKDVMILSYAHFARVFGFEARELGLLSALREAFGDGFRARRIDANEGPVKLAKALSAKDAPTALFMLSDTLSRALLEALARTSIEIPRDLSVAGFDNMINTPEDWRMESDSIDQPWLEIGAQAYRLLKQLMETPDLTEGAGRKILLRPSLVVKGSVARVP